MILYDTDEMDGSEVVRDGAVVQREREAGVLDDPAALTNIFSFLDAKSLLLAQLTCKTFCEVANIQAVWRCVGGVCT